MKKVKTLENDQLAKYVSSQLNLFFPDQNPVQADELLVWMNQAEERVFECFYGIKKKYFTEHETVYFNHLQTDQYCMYLYMLANFIYKNQGNLDLATKLYYLNKVMHSVDVYFTTDLPPVFLFVHPSGTILGRGKFHGRLVAYQGCTVGCLNEGIFPVFKGDVILYSHASVLGTCHIGHNVCIGTGVQVINTDVPDNTVVTGTYPNYQLRENRKSIVERPPFVYSI
jgi:serine O-acetyltransferase